ncbi:hypothetical protein VTL71DRAFT_10859 [Oculimacula yallundae]|uniref:RRM domain-containing protein n=1 Tax=Oculimacula yallundae TaxID=86028 RepID=A0ABR4CU69_9HELO
MAKTTTAEISKSPFASPKDTPNQNEEHTKSDSARWSLESIDAIFPELGFDSPKDPRLGGSPRTKILPKSVYPPPPFPQSESSSLVLKKVALNISLIDIVELVENLTWWKSAREKGRNSNKFVFVDFDSPEDAQHAMEWLFKDVVKGDCQDIQPILLPGAARDRWLAELMSWKAIVTEPPDHEKVVHPLGDFGGKAVKIRLDDINTAYPHKLWQQRVMRFVVEEFQNLKKNFRSALHLQPQSSTIEDLANEYDEAQYLRDGYFKALSKIWEVMGQIDVINSVFWFHPKLSDELVTIVKEIRPLRHNMVHNIGTDNHRMVDIHRFHRFLNIDRKVEDMFAGFIEMRRTWSAEMLVAVRGIKSIRLRERKKFVEKMEPLLLCKVIAKWEDFKS